MSALQHSPAGLADNAMVFQLRSFSHLHVAGTVVAKLFAERRLANSQRISA